VIWTAGVKASHLGQKLTEATGCEVDRGGRVIVNPDFSIPNHPEIRIAGDLCSYSHTVNGTQLPGMAAPAKLAGTFIGMTSLRSSPDVPAPPSATSISAAWPWCTPVRSLT
jgi:NADH dehydrogenase